MTGLSVDLGPRAPGPRGSPDSSGVVLVSCAGLMTPHECPTVGLLPSECALRARMPSEARADGERWRPSVRHSGGVVRPAPNIKPSRM